MNTYQKGSYYEVLAAEELERQGYTILERNFRCKYGEIDIIAQDGKYLAFVEVKYRSTYGAGDPTEAVDFRKIQKISFTATYYMMKKKIPETTPMRFDLVSILGDKVNLIKNAFDYVGR